MPQKMTRKKAAAYLRQRGFPIGDSTLDKLCMPSSADGPPVAAWWGRRPLYEPADVLAWAEAKLRPVQTCASRLESVASNTEREVPGGDPDTA
jgi:hypothetical protein